MNGRLPSETSARRLSDPGDLLVSRAIGIARLICILGIVYVHGWTGLSGELMAAQAGSPQDMLRWTLVELFGRSAVPLLSLVSGWLIGQSLARRGPRRFLRGKARALLVPMLLWNMLALVLVVGAAMLGVPDLPLLGGPQWLADNLLSLTRPADINVQTAFLRDLFLCMLAAPLLLRLPTRALLLIVAATALWVVGGWQLYLLLRPGILLFFVIGIIARRHGLAERIGDLSPWLAALPFFAVLPFKIWLSMRIEAGLGDPVALINAVDLLMRSGAALMVWRGAMGLASRRLGSQMLAFERYAFFLFCSHLLFMWLVAPAIGAMTGPMGSPGWPIFFLAQPLLALGFAMAAARILEALAPKTAELLSGGRLGRAQTTSPAARPLAQAHWKL
jgi:hypothetical protein